MYFTVQGSGKPVVFLHGWGCNGQIFSQTASLLPHFRCYLPDFNGFGSSSAPPPSGWNVTDYAIELRRFLSINGITRPLLVGHSFGCRVAVRFASLFPNDAIGLLLFAPAGIKRFSPSLWMKKVVYKAKKALHLSTNGCGSTDYRACSPTMLPTFLKVVNQDLSPCLSLVTAPTLVICGSQDDQTPPWMARKIHRKIHGSSLTVVDGDHFAMFYRPHAFAKAITLFYDAVSPSAP